MRAGEDDCARSVRIPPLANCKIQRKRRAESRVEGLPAAGFVPGEEYEITFRWPEEAPVVSVIGEIVTDLRDGAGKLEIPEEGRRNTSGEIYPLSDGRVIFSILAYEETSARVLWTAPMGSEPAFVHAMVVSGDDSGDPSGDRVTEYSTRLLPASVSPPAIASGGCRISARTTIADWSLCFYCVLMGGRLQRRRWDSPRRQSCHEK